MSSAGLPGDIQTLDAFTVAATRELNASAIAVNEQRYAANLKNVMAADAFGDSTDGNVGDFLKFLPGINIDFVPDARSISVRGMAANYTSVTVDGLRMANAGSVATSRAFELEQVSINNVSRVEVVKSRTPDLPADALGGSVNMISKSAFERSRPSFTYKAYGNFNSQALTLAKTPGPGNEPTRKTQPGVDFSLIYPLSKTPGFTLSGLHSENYYPQDRTQPLYAPNSTTLPGATIENPILRRWDYQDGPQNTTRDSISGTVDWKFAAHDTVSLTAQYNNFDRFGAQRLMQFDIGGVAPIAYGPDFVKGALGRGTVTTGNGSAFRRKFGQTYAFGLNYEHRGAIWKIDGGLGLSHSKTIYEDTKGGFFEAALLTLRGTPTVNFFGLDKHAYLRPDRIEVLNATGGAPIDYTDLGNYNITSVTSLPDGPGIDVIKTARLNASRPLPGAIPVTIKAGLQVQQQARDIRKDRPGTLNFVGPDGRAGTADDSAGLYDILDQSFSSVAPPYGVPPRGVYADHYKLYQLFVANPGYFAASNAANPIINSANLSQNLRETISAAYLMGDVKMIDSRLRVVGGVRFEHTDDRGEGVRNDPNETYQRNAQGQFVLNSAGQRVRISTDPVLLARAQYTERGSNVRKSYEGAYPSLDASFAVNSQLLVRAAYARSIGRPELSSIIPGTTITDASVAAPSVTVINTGLKPMQTNAYDLAVEYYFEPVGLLAVNGYLKEFSNASGSVSQRATLDLLEAYGVTDAADYVGWDFRTVRNVGAARITGLEIDFRRTVNLPFLPAWARGISVFANGSQSHLEDNGLSEFGNYIRRQASWGVIFENRRVSANAKFNYRGRQRMGAQTFAPGAYDYYQPRLYLDINAALRFSRHLSLFINGRNVTNEPQNNDRFGAGTPGYNAIRKVERFGGQFTAGIKGTY